MDFWREFSVVGNFLKVQHLEKQAQQDPRVIGQLIRGYERLLKVFQPERDPLAYAELMNNLGNAYSRLITGRRSANLDKAITSYEEALKFWLPAESPFEYAVTMENMGSAYRDKPEKRISDLKKAIVCFQNALRFVTPASNSQEYARIQNNMGLAYCDLFFDDAKNVEAAITCYEEALRFWAPETTPLEYARTCGNLGIAYCRLSSDDRAASIQRGIECFLKALDFQNAKTTRIEYARTQTNLGAAYSMLPTHVLADRKVNLAKAIACYQEALRFQSPKATPTDYEHTQYNLDLASHQLRYLERSQRSDQPRRLTQKQPQGFKDEFRSLPHRVKELFYEIEILVEQLQNNPQVAEPLISLCQQILSLVPPGKRHFFAFLQTLLGSAYYQQPEGNRAENLSSAIACYEKALEIFTLEDAPQDHALVENDLGTAYAELSYVTLSMRARTEAITHFKQALRVWTPEAAPLDYALVQNNLGVIYSELPVGNPTDDDPTGGDPTTGLQQAIACYKEAASLLTDVIAPLEHASIQVNLGNAYARLRTGKRAENFQMAKECYEEALKKQTLEDFPFEYARIKHNLGTVYRDSPEGDHEHNLLQAIACYEESLQILTGEIYPFEYAQVQNSLGAIYADLSTGDHVTNLFQAIKCYEKALTVFTPEKYPFHYAHTQNNLGHAYGNLPSDAYRENIPSAIDCYRNALRFQTPETAPADCRKTSRNLADLYFTEGAWEAALSAYQTAVAAGKRLYEAGLFLEGKAVEIAQNATLYHNAAFSAVCCGKKDEALRILENGKTQLLKEALRVRVPRPANVPDEDWCKFEQTQKEVRKNQADEINEINQRSDRMQASLHTAMNGVQVAHAAKDAADKAIRQVRRSAPGFLEEMSIQAIQNVVSDETTSLLTFCITKQGSFGFIVSQGDIQVVDIRKFTQADLRRLFVEWDAHGGAVGGWLGAYASLKEAYNQLLEAYNRLFYEQTYTNLKQAQEQFQATRVVWQATIINTLTELSQRLLAPMLDALNSHIKRIILLPTAELFTFPLHAAPLPSTASTRVCDHYQVSSIPSIEVFNATQARITQDVEHELYAVIDTDPGRPLVFAQIERIVITSLFKNSQVDEKWNATKQRVIKGMREKPYVHFSCHGEYNWNDPPASGLVLVDSCLTLADLQHGDIDLSSARLVTLSACETGITDVVQGSAEEYVGIPAGFILAGVPCVVSSLWSVEEFSTALLMMEFYRRHVKGQSIVEALWEAQCWLRHLTRDGVVAWAREIYELIEDKSQVGDRNAFVALFQEELQKGDYPEDPPFDHPYYWAAFFVAGA